MDRNNSPIRLSKNGDGEIVRILLLDEWYDVLKPVYDHFATVSGMVGVKEYPEHFEEIADSTAQLFNHLIIEYGVAGWGFVISMFTILRWAAEQAISLRKFTYETTGRVGHSRVGEFKSGGGTVVRELPVEG